MGRAGRAIRPVDAKRFREERICPRKPDSRSAAKCGAPGHPTPDRLESRSLLDRAARESGSSRVAPSSSGQEL